MTHASVGNRVKVETSNAATEKSQDLDSKSQVYKTKLLLTFTAKLRSVITSESTVMTFELHTLCKRKL